MKRPIGKKPPAKSRAKSTPVITLTGSPLAAQQTWWSKRFIEVLESFRMGGRLARGKAYAEESKVLKLTLSNGIVTSTVQGSRKAHYRVTIRMQPLSENAWKHVMYNMTKKAIYAVEMLQDKMPRDIEEVFNAASISLFPSKLEELESECDCPDWSNPCKHIAATYYILAQHFDLDPFLIFMWRGRMKTQILDYLRTYWRTGKPRSYAFKSVQRRDMAPGDFERHWHGNLSVPELTPLDPFSEAVPDSGIKQLGEAPVQLDGRDLAEIFAESYSTTSEAIRDWIQNQPGKSKAVMS